MHQLAGDVQGLCAAFLRGLQAVLGEKLYGVYLYGSVVFPDPGPIGDVDFHVILRESLESEESQGLRDLHALLARDFAPLGAEMDGYYILLDEARGASPPRHQLLPGVTDGAWALHRAHIRAGRYVALYGPDPRDMYLPPSWAELADALLGELHYVERHLDTYPAYCVLNLCRLMYSCDSREVVVSKREAAAWARDALPRWRRLVNAASGAYGGGAAEGEQLVSLEVVRFFQFARECIARSLGGDLG